MIICFGNVKYQHCSTFSIRRMVFASEKRRIGLHAQLSQNCRIDLLYFGLFLCFGDCFGLLCYLFSPALILFQLPPRLPVSMSLHLPTRSPPLALWENTLPIREVWLNSRETLFLPVIKYDANIFPTNFSRVKSTFTSAMQNNFKGNRGYPKRIYDICRNC